ncbi:MAG: hypothetical protein ACREH5_06905 [Candidatus Omnitrophota bacterium]
MKTLAKVAGMVSVMALLASPVFALEAGSEKPLSVTEFAKLVDNHGASFRMIENRYQEYRKGRWIPKSTLETERLR